MKLQKSGVKPPHSKKPISEGSGCEQKAKSKNAGLNPGRYKSKRRQRWRLADVDAWDARTNSAEEIGGYGADGACDEICGEDVIAVNTVDSGYIA